MHINPFNHQPYFIDEKTSLGQFAQNCKSLSLGEVVFETGKSGSGVFSHYTTLPLKEMVGVNSNKTTLRRTQILSLSVLKIFSIYKQSPVLKLNSSMKITGLDYTLNFYID